MATTNWTTDESLTQEDWQTLYEVNGEQLTLDELQSGYMRQSDYTRKTQELKKSEPREEEDESWIETVKSKWFMTNDEFETKLSSKLAEREFDNDVLSSPELKKHEKAIRKLVEQTWMSPYDVIDEYWFGKSEKLKKAKESRLLWDRDYGTWPKSIWTMSDDEVDEYISKNSKMDKYRVSGT